MPNKCSGHGNCDKHGKCECHQGFQVYHVYLKHAQDNAQVMVFVKNQASANAPKVTLATHVTFSSGDVKKIATTMAPV